MNRTVIKQDYQLVNAKYKLNTSELKFILCAITQINADDEEFKEYEIKVSELEKTLRSEQNSTRLKQFAKKLMSKPLEVASSNGWTVFNWFSKIQYNETQLKFTVRIDEDLKPYLLSLKKRFIQYNLKYILPLTSNYSIRIYQLLKEYEKLNKRYFNVEELQEILQVPPSYKKKYNDFKKKVLQIAEKELLEHCDIYFTFEEEKEGRKVSRLIFRIYPNPKNHREKAKEIKETLSQYENLTKQYKGKILYYNGCDNIIQEVLKEKKTDECDVLLIDNHNKPRRYTMPFIQLTEAK